MSRCFNKGHSMTAETTRYLDEATTADLLSISRRTLQRWRLTGEGPVFVRLGARRVAYPENGVKAWAAARTYAHRAAELAQRSAA
jgi:predicted DNA-binding transcriptional regulator AlpA